MSKSIWKFGLAVVDTQVIAMPRGAVLLAVQTQFDEPQVWALVDHKEPDEPVRFRIYGTGHPVDDDPGQFVGTFQLSGGSLVFHVFRQATGEGA